MKINKIYKLIIDNIPSEYHFDIKICKSTNNMFESLIKRDKLDCSVEDLLEYYGKYFNTTGKDSLKIAKKYPNKPRKRNKCIYYAISGNPILLNRYELDYETPLYIAAVILHEFGHNIGYRSENGANRFALLWMKKISKVIKEHYE